MIVFFKGFYPENVLKNDLADKNVNFKIWASVNGANFSLIDPSKKVKNDRIEDLKDEDLAIKVYLNKHLPYDNDVMLDFLF